MKLRHQPPNVYNKPQIWTVSRSRLRGVNFTKCKTRAGQVFPHPLGFSLVYMGYYAVVIALSRHRGCSNIRRFRCYCGQVIQPLPTNHNRINCMLCNLQWSRLFGIKVYLKFDEAIWTFRDNIFDHIRTFRNALLGLYFIHTFKPQPYKLYIHYNNTIQ